MLLELGEVPAGHLLKSELLLEHRVDVEVRRGLVVSDINKVTSVSGHDDSLDVADFSFKTGNFLRSVGETNEEEFAAVFMSGPDDRSDQVNVHVKGVLSAGGVSAEETAS